MEHVKCMPRRAPSHSLLVRDPRSPEPTRTGHALHFPHHSPFASLPPHRTASHRRHLPLRPKPLRKTLKPPQHAQVRSAPARPPREPATFPLTVPAPTPAASWPPLPPPCPVPLYNPHARPPPDARCTQPARKMTRTYRAHAHLLR